MAHGSTMAQKKWGAAIPDGVKPEAGKPKTVAISQMMRQCGIGGGNGYASFPTASRSRGSCRDALHTCWGKPNNSPRASLAPTSSARLRERDAKSGRADAQALRGEAMEHVGRGWLSRTSPLADSGHPPRRRSSSYNVAVRFGAQEDANHRDCDDPKNRWAIRCFRNRTPIHRVTWGHIDQIPSILTKDGCEWRLIKADREAAYKQPPIAPADQWAEIVALRRPNSGKLLGFVARTLVFGSVSAVLRYNALSRIWTAPARHLLGRPCWGNSTTSKH